MHNALNIHTFLFASLREALGDTYHALALVIVVGLLEVLFFNGLPPPPPSEVSTGDIRNDLVRLNKTLTSE